MTKTLILKNNLDNVPLQGLILSPLPYLYNIEYFSFPFNEFVLIFFVQPDTYGFDNCDGCMPCECGQASVSSQCDANNGSCICQPGVTGHKCQSCIPGYWNYADTGCQRKFIFNIKIRVISH